MYTIRPDTKFKFDNTIIKDKPVKGVGLSEDGNFLMIRQKVGGFLGFGRTTVRTVVDVSEMESNAKKDLMKRIATQISGTHFWNSKNKHKNIINDNGLNENSVITIKYKSKDRGTKLGQARIALKIIHGNKNNDNTFFHGLRNSAEFQDNPYVSGEVKKQIQGKMKEGDKLLKRLNEAYSKIVWPIKAEDIIEGYKDKKFDGDLLRSLINDPTILSKEQQVSLFMGFAKDGQLDAIKQFFQNSKEFEQEKSKILQLLKKEETTDQNKTAIDSAIDMVIDSMTLKEVNFAIKTESTYNIQSKTSKKLNKKWKSLRNIKTNQTKKKKP